MVAISVNMSRQLRGAVIGYGFIASHGHAPTYLRGNGVKIVAVADLCEDQRRRAQRDIPGVRVYPDHQSLLQAEVGRDLGKLDFLDIATPPCDHARVAHAAFDHGLHVICEKPLATTVEEGRAMLDHAQSARRVLYPGHNYKHAPVVKSVRQVIESGVIGPVHLVTLQTFRNTHAKGVASWRPDWRRDRDLSGGGIAMDHGSHTFYLAFEWMRSYPSAVTAYSSTRSGFDTEDEFGCTLTFPTGMATAHLSWTSGMRKVLYTLHGARGAIRVDDEDIEVSVLEKGPGVAAAGSPGVWRIERGVARSDWMDASHAGWFGSLFEEFRGAIDRREYVGKDAREALLCMQVITRAYASARESSRQLSLGEALLPDSRLFPQALAGDKLEHFA